MNEHISVMTWNVQGEIGISEKRMQNQLAFLEAHTQPIDLILFQAVNYEPKRGNGWGGQLGSLLEYFEQTHHEYEYVHTADWAHELYESDVQPHQEITSPHNRCNLTVSRWPIERTSLSLRSDGNGYPRKLTNYSTHFPEKILVSHIDLTDVEATTAESLDVWNVAIINGSNWHEEKLKMLETVYSRLYLQNKRTDRPTILGGDFNAPRHEDDRGTITPHGQGLPKYTRYPLYGDPYFFGETPTDVDEYTFEKRWQRAEANIFDPEISEWDMRDAYWAASSCRKRASSEDHTHEIPSGPRKRLDHIFVSDHFTVDRCIVLNGNGDTPCGLGVSDHAPVVVDLINGR